MEKKIVVESVMKSKNKNKDEEQNNNKISLTDTSNKLGFQVEEEIDDYVDEDDVNNEGNDVEMGNIDEIIKKSQQMKINANLLANKDLTNPILKEFRRLLVPTTKLKQLKENWPTIVKAVIEHMKLEIRMNVKAKCIELRTCENTNSTSAMQKSEDFLKAFLCGFDLSDAIALLRLEDLFFETFDIKDVKALKGDHLSRCIGRICGEKGKTRHAIENATRTRVIVEGHKISLLGGHINCGMARNAICSLILGAQPGKVYSQLRIMGRKLNEL